MADAKTLNFLLSEIQTVRKIYDALDEGVETNSQIHRSLIQSLCPDDQDSNTSLPQNGLNIPQKSQYPNHTNQLSDGHQNNCTTNNNQTTTPTTTKRLKSHAEHSDQNGVKSSNSSHQRNLPQAPRPSNSYSANSLQIAHHHSQSKPQYTSKQNGCQDQHDLETHDINGGDNYDDLKGSDNIVALYTDNGYVSNCVNPPYQQHHHHTQHRHNHQQDQHTFQQPLNQLQHTASNIQQLFAKTTDVIIAGNKPNKVTFVSPPSNRVVNSKTPSPTDLLLSSTPRQTTNCCQAEQFTEAGYRPNSYNHLNHQAQQQHQRHHVNNESTNSASNEGVDHVTPRGDHRFVVRKERQGHKEDIGIVTGGGGGGGCIEGVGQDDLERGDQLERRSSGVEEHYRITTHNADRSQHAAKTKHTKISGHLAPAQCMIQETNSHSQSFNFQQTNDPNTHHTPHSQLKHVNQQQYTPVSNSQPKPQIKQLPFNTYTTIQEPAGSSNTHHQNHHHPQFQNGHESASNKHQIVNKGNNSQAHLPTNHQQQNNSEKTPSVPNLGGMSTDALRNLVAQLQLDLMDAVKKKEEAQGEMRHLEGKLEATENTVLRQSRKMKTYRIALEGAGVNVPLTHRSSSEASLSRGGKHLTDPQCKSCDYNSKGCNMERRNSMGNLHWPVNRDDKMNMSTLSEKDLKFTTFSSTPRKKLSAQKHSYHSKEECRHQHKNHHNHNTNQPITMKPNQDVKGHHHHHQQHQSHNNKIPKGIKLSHPNHNHTNVTNSDNLRLRHHHQFWEDGCSSVENVDPKHLRRNSGSSKSDFDSPRSATERDFCYHHYHQQQQHHQTHHRNGHKHDHDSINSKYDERKSSLYPYDSFLTNDFSQEKANQLESAITQQIHLVVTQREEINTHELLLESLGISLDKTQLQNNNDDGCNTHNNRHNNKTDDATETIIKQLSEIRNMRQHLETLNLEGNKGHPCMYESHVNHLISHQESIISTLKQKLTDDKTKMKNELNEMKELISTERDSIREKLCQAEAEIENQKSSIENFEKVIKNLENDLKKSLNNEREMTGEIETLKCEQKENKDELMTREKENIELQKNVTTLELVKEDLESRIRILETDIEDSEKQKAKFKKDLVVYRDTCKDLREAVECKEDTMRHQLQALQVLTDEKTEVENAVDNMKREINCLREEQNKVLDDLEEKESIKIKFNELLIDLDQRRVQERQLVKEKTTLEAEVEVLQEERKRQQQVCEVQHGGLALELSKVKDEKLHMENRLSTLEIEAKSRRMLEEEIISVRTMFDRKCTVESELRRDLTETEANMRKMEKEKGEIEDELHDKMEKISRRDRQCQHLCDKFNKLDLAFTKQNRALREKTEDVISLRRQIQLYEKTMDTNAHEKQQDTTTKELLNELVLAKRQVADLMTRLEGSSNYLPDIRVDAFGTGILGSTTTTTTTTTTNNNNGKNSLGVNVGANKSQTIFVNIGGHPGEHLSDEHMDHPSSLFAILKKDLFEKVRGEMEECSADAKLLEGRITDTPKNNKDCEKQDMTPACQRIRANMEEALRILSLAWITELPPMDSQGNFYNPELAEENDSLKSELTRLRTKCDVLDLTVKNHQGRLDASAQRHKNWEEAVFRQYELMFRRPSTPNRVHVTHYINGVKPHPKP